MKVAKALKILAGAAILFAFALVLQLGLAVTDGLRASRSTDTQESYQRPQGLMNIYRAIAPPVLVMFSMSLDPRIEGCEIDPATLDHDGFGDGDKAWTPYGGYFELTLWQSERFRRETRDRQAKFVDRNFSKFEQGFLISCMTKSFFGEQCVDHIRRRFAAGGWQDPVNAVSLPSSEPAPSDTFGDKTICTYLRGAVGSDTAERAR